MFCIKASMTVQPWLVAFSDLVTLQKYVQSTIVDKQVVVYISSIITSILFLAPFTLGMFFKRQTKVNTIVILRKFLKFDVVALGVTYFASAVLSVLYLIDSGAGVICLYLFVDTVCYALMTVYVYKFYRDAQQCELALIAYHDFLINYRQTPRSKILKRHMPELAAVVEEESMFEQSQMF